MDRNYNVLYRAHIADALDLLCNISSTLSFNKSEFNRVDSIFLRTVRIQSFWKTFPYLFKFYWCKRRTLQCWTTFWGIMSDMIFHLPWACDSHKFTSRMEHFCSSFLRRQFLGMDPWFICILRQQCCAMVLWSLEKYTTVGRNCWFGSFILSESQLQKAHTTQASHWKIRAWDAILG